MTVDPSIANEVSAPLLQYLRHRLPQAAVRYGEALEQVGHSTSAYVYGFRLEGNCDPQWTEPLVVRIGTTRQQGPAMEREAAVQQFVADRAYRTPRLLAVEVVANPLGLPFTIMERVPGRTMLEEFTARPLSMLHLAALMADAQVGLHRLPVGGYPLRDEGYLVDRRLAYLREQIDRYELREAEEAFTWLKQRRGVVIPEELSLCHNDFHPLNLVLDRSGRVTVLDWSRAELGDRLHDLARTLVLFSLASGGGRNVVEQLLTRVTGVIGRRYLTYYRRHLAVDHERLHYWRALLTLQSWVETAPMISLGPEALGATPDALAGYPSDILDKIRRAFWKLATSAGSSPAKRI